MKTLLLQFYDEHNRLLVFACAVEDEEDIKVQQTLKCDSKLFDKAQGLIDHFNKTERSRTIQELEQMVTAE